jgi:hypothetical protein
MMKKLTAVLLIALTMTLLSAEKYAVLITGDYAAKGVPESALWQTGSTERAPMAEFWHDTYLMWEMLYKNGFKDENIHVLFADGEDFYLTDAGDWVADRYRPQWADMPTGFTITDGAATKNNIRNAASDLKSKMSGDDFLFVWTMSHSSGSSIYLLKDDLSGNRAVSFETFANYFKPLNALNKVYWLSMNNAEILSENLAQENVRFINSYEYFGIKSKND